MRLAHRVAELENLPHGLSEKSRVLKVGAPPVSLLSTVPAFTSQLSTYSPLGQNSFANPEGRTICNTVLVTYSFRGAARKSAVSSSLSPFWAQVRDMYVESFKELREFPAIEDMPDEIKFCGLLDDIYQRHKNVVPLLALGVSELKRDFKDINEVSRRSC